MYGAEFDKIALALHKAKPAKDEFQFASKRVQWSIDIQVLAMVFQDLNPRFDYEKFRNRCNNG